LTSSGFDAPDILRAVASTGIDLQELRGLGEKLNAAGVPYLPNQMYAGTGSDHGINFEDLIAGGLGTAYDWREDPLAHLKGRGAISRLLADRQLAENLKLTPNTNVTKVADKLTPYTLRYDDTPLEFYNKTRYPALTTAPTPAPTTAPTPAPATAPTPAPTAAPSPVAGRPYGDDYDPYYSQSANAPAPTTAPTSAPTATPTPAPLKYSEAIKQAVAEGIPGARSMNAQELANALSIPVKNTSGTTRSPTGSAAGGIIRKAKTQIQHKGMTPRLKKMLEGK
jgi:hypothetical protein